MPAFLRISPELRINLENVTVIREPDINETFDVFDASRPGPAVMRRMGLSGGAVLVEFMGKKTPVIVSGEAAHRLKNFVDGVGHSLSGSGEVDTDTADITSAIRGERDFGALTAGG